ncbi:MAG TPA: ACT domain-containing protein, partial [Gemmatimonadales bacterium]|nr:ACT domain-containing protein [Gemmatimonadales bacterium]
LARAAQSLGLSDGPLVEVALGRGDATIVQVIRAIYPDLPVDDLQEPKPSVIGRVIDRIRLGSGIRIQGLSGLLVRYAQCCQPVPGDQVVGYVTQGRGISIHRADCPNLLTLSGEGRRVEIDWQESKGEAFAVRLAVTGEDRRGLYADVMQAISQSGTNVKAAELSTKDGGIFSTIVVEVDNRAHLARVIKAIRKVKGINDVERREVPLPSASS